jgi:hypothetical protein
VAIGGVAVGAVALVAGKAWAKRKKDKQDEERRATLERRARFDDTWPSLRDAVLNAPNREGDMALDTVDGEALANLARQASREQRHREMDDDELHRFLSYGFSGFRETAQERAAFVSSIAEKLIERKVAADIANRVPDCLKQIFATGRGGAEGRLAWSHGNAYKVTTLIKDRYEMNYPGEELSETVWEILFDVSREKFLQRWRGME